MQLTSRSENNSLKVVAHLETLVKEHCLGCTAEHTSTTVNYLKVLKVCGKMVLTGFLKPPHRPRLRP